ARRVVLRIEVKDVGRPGERARSNLLAGLILEREARCAAAGADAVLGARLRRARLRGLRGLRGGWLARLGGRPLPGLPGGLGLLRGFRFRLFRARHVTKASAVRPKSRRDFWVVAERRGSAKVRAPTPQGKFRDARSP